MICHLCESIPAGGFFSKLVIAIMNLWIPFVLDSTYQSIANHLTLGDRTVDSGMFAHGQLLAAVVSPWHALHMSAAEGRAFSSTATSRLHHQQAQQVNVHYTLQ